MGFMAWSTEFEFGIPEMDLQHKHWLEILNRFYDDLERNQIDNNLVVLITEAVDYTRYHFLEEEKFMKTLGYPAIEDQKRLHKEITEKIEVFKTRIEEGKPVLSMAVTNEFKNWFKNHILVEDRKYADMYIKLNR